MAFPGKTLRSAPRRRQKPVRKILLPGVALIVLFLFAGAASAQSVSIQLESGAFKLVGWKTLATPPANGWASVFSVTRVPAMSLRCLGHIQPRAARSSSARNSRWLPACATALYFSLLAAHGSRPHSTARVRKPRPRRASRTSTPPRACCRATTLSFTSTSLRP